MVMKASLQLKLGQSLTMTPQLQQAIRLLQLSTLDLQQEIQQALESNPMLEAPEDDDHGDEESTHADASDDQNTDSSAADVSLDTSNDWDENENGPDWASENEIPDTLPDDLPVDTAWDDVYQSAPAPASSNGDDNDYDFETRNSPTETLRDHLEWQLNLTTMTDRDRAVAHALMDAVDERGYLNSSLAEIYTGLQDEHDDDRSEERRVGKECVP